MLPTRKRTGDDGVWDLNDVEEKHKDSTQWGLIATNTYKGFPSTQDKLPKGVYSITLDRNDGRPMFIRREIKTDDIIFLEESITSSVLQEIALFWGKEKLFKSHGFLHRRGYLFYGPQGTGKSSVVKQIMADVVENDGLVFLCDNPKFLNEALITLRQAEPERHLVCVFEDIDAIVHKYGEDDLLAVLDGANMVNNVLNVATTNYPERLDRRIVARPRRFDRVIKVAAPNDKIRTEFLKAQLPKVGSAKIATLVNKTEGLSLAAISEMIISVYCLGNDLDETIKILKALAIGIPSSTEFEAKDSIGFVSDFGKGGDDYDNVVDDD